MTGDGAIIGSGQASEWAEHGPPGWKMIISTGTHKTGDVSTLI